MRSLLLFSVTVSALRAPAVRTVAYGTSTYSAAVVPASDEKLPPIVVLPPIGVGIDRTFCGRFLEAWAADESAGSALHAIDMLGMGDSTPKPVMKKPFGGWAEPPRTPKEWAEQTLSYVRDEVREPCVIVGQSNLCTVALECSKLDTEGLVKAVVLLGPPAVEALTIDKPQESIAKVWRVVGSPVGAALYRFARRKAFLSSFSKKNLFADPSQVDDAYLDTCAAGKCDARRAAPLMMPSSFC
jgi:pimeloyl-ACP methyl ester carboxylesterase